MPEHARTDQAIVYVMDDEPSIRNSTKELAESVGLRVQTFAAAVRISERLQAHPGEQGSTSTGEGSTHAEDQGPT